MPPPQAAPQNPWIGDKGFTQGLLITDLCGLNVLNTVIVTLAQYREDVRRYVLRYWNAP